METSTSSGWDLAHLLVVLRRRRAWIVGATLVALVAAIVLSLLMPVTYESQAELVVEPELLPSNPDEFGRAYFVDQELTTQLRLLQSEVVASRVAEAMDLESTDVVADHVTATLLPSTRVIRVVGSAADPQRAADFAQTVTEQYLEFRREDTLDRLLEATSSLRSRLDAAQQNLEQLDQRLQETSDPATLASLRDERDAAAQAVANLELQIERLQSADPAGRGGGRIIRAADVPDAPTSPQPVRNTAVAVVLGLGLGVVLAIVVEAVDQRVNDADEAARLAGRPVLGRIPLAPRDRGGDLPMLNDPTGSRAEAFRDLRTSLRFGASDPPRSIVVASPTSGEGRATTAANLALAAAAAGQRVVLVDADLRQSSIGRLFGIDDRAGLSDVLEGEYDLSETLLVLEGLGLDLLLSGGSPSRLNELEGPERMQHLLGQLADSYDFVVVDVPPVLAVPDVLDVAPMVDSALLVVELRRSGGREVREACERLERVGAQLSGLVVTRAHLDPHRPLHYDEAVAKT